MISELFRTSEFVKVLDFLLDDPLSQYIKIDIADGANISRPTLDKLMPDLLRLGILIKVRNLGPATVYEMDIKSPFVVSLIKFNAEIGKVFATRNIDSLSMSRDYETFPDVIHMPQHHKFEEDMFLKNALGEMLTLFSNESIHYFTSVKKVRRRIVDESDELKYLELETTPIFSEA